MSESAITYHESGAVSFVGPDAVEVFRAACLASAMGLYKAGIRFAGTMTGAEALKDASRYTGQKYKRGEYDRARNDLRVWVDAMKAALTQQEVAP